MDQNCAICGDLSDTWEHVYPKWFLANWDETGPFTARANGQPLRTRAGVIRTNSKMWRILLPLCRKCNNDLDRLFEKTAKGPVRRLLRDMQPLNDRAAVTEIARWTVKTLALASHPDARFEALASQAQKRYQKPWTDYPRAILESIGVGAVPNDTSLWFALTDPSRPGLPDPPFEEVLLRHTSRADNLGGSGRTRTTGFALTDDRIGWFQLAYHPLHDFVHPFERHALVTRLWPNPPERLDVRDHPVLDRKTRLTQVLVDDGFRHVLDLGQRSNGPGPPWGEW
ncbi:hypothetical protein DE4576_04946 [Mycobacterium marinum]|nr:hypothetical protein DE4576_04946 [Mycobacterium marinum]